MKTFETEKHNIPEGATGYRKQGDYIEWFGGRDGCWRLIASTVPSMEMCNTSKPVKPIPQTNIETPEEKEVLDLIDTTPHQYESVASKEVEWVNGDECNYGGVDGFVVGYCRDSSWIVIEHSGEVEAVNVEHISKPETPQQREERERLEAAYDLYCTGNKGLNVTAPCTFDVFESDEIQCKFWLAIVDKTNYRKESE